MEIKETSELILLQKALHFIKFGVDENEARHVAVSPITGKILEILKRELHEEMKKYDKLHSKALPNHFDYIENYSHFLKKVYVHISNIDNWSQYDEQIQIETIKSLISPYKVQDSTIREILEKFKSF